jgi:endonuclease/exonuclease/phosphatase (EEP) superfamily protein YafD
MMLIKFVKFITGLMRFLTSAKVLNTLATLFFLVGLISFHFASSHWLIDILVHFTKFYLLFIIVVAILDLSYGKYKLFALQMVFCLTLLLPQLLLFNAIGGGGGKAQVSQSREYKLLSWNALYLNKNYDEAIKVIQQEQPDFIFIVEAWPHLTDRLNDALKNDYQYIHPVKKKNWRSHAFLSKHGVDRLDYVHFKASANKRYRLLKASLTLDGTMVDILGVHTASPMSHNKFIRRNEHLARVANYIENNYSSNNSTALILAGDFNITAFSAIFHQFIDKTRLHYAHIWQSSFYSYSWPFLLPWGITIDHVLYNDKIKVTSKYNRGISNSDHLAVIITFTLD